MEILIKILQFILSFSLLVIIHELGHFTFAKIFKTRVEKFYLFFNPWFSLFKFKKGETEYGVGWIPFGGYVKISGMVDESMDTEQMKQPAQPYEFRAKPAWQRLLIMVGGVLMNVLLAVAIYIGISFAWGETYLANRDVEHGYTFNELGREIGFENGDKIVDIAGKPLENAMLLLPSIVFDQAPYVTVERDGARRRIEIPEEAMARLIESRDFAAPRLPFVVGEVVSGTEAAKAGIRPGDTFVSIDGEPIRYYDQYRKVFEARKGDTVRLSLMRDSAGITRLMTLPVKVSSEGTVGTYLARLDKILKLSSHDYTFWQAIPAGIKRTGSEIGSYFKQIKLIFTPKTEAYKSVGGILAIGNIFPDYWSWEEFWRITAFLSIMLAVVNILPIPALDGGHVLFLLVEVVTRRKPSDKFLERAQIAGLFILLALLVFANGNDIYRFFIK
ncbi:RIP metalloprotease RseP [uncultured Alistipes sp.]|uniref:RIP metalloprotease RseP n=1 Tax=uncultured Alistipes sp. TaxID=538949 RepID=UPI0026371C9E|nr:RIP metalloprotease RseP [uncultured Alistipes sp.]